MLRKAVPSRYVFASCLTSYYYHHQSKAYCQLSSSANKTLHLTNMRKEYSKQYLEDETLPNNPMELFLVWMKEAKEAQVLEPNAMCLSTCQNNQPTGRMVLLKDFDDRGFVWFTNYQSRKASDLQENPRASLTFWWGDLERAVRVEGKVEKTSEEESDAYHSVRPVGAQIGAWSSHQSSPVESRQKLQEQESIVREKLSKEYLQKGVPIPRPEHWGGYRLSPQRIEFWKGREGRMHDRIVYERKEHEGKMEWVKTRLQP